MTSSLHKIIAVSIVAAVIIAIYFAPWQRVEAIGSIQKRLQLELTDLSNSVAITASEVPNELPESGEIDRHTLELLARHSDFTPDGRYLVGTGTGLEDRWGHRIHLLLLKDDKSLSIQVWSCGKNGLNEQGIGDDIIASTRAKAN